MIGRLRGTIVDRLPDGSCILEVGGVGYELFIPLGTLGRLPVAPEAVTLHVHTHVREDALVLYGFARPEDRSAFRTLLSISNIGPKLALAILSHLDARELASAIARQDAVRFKGIPGVGKRTVERLLLELKDKLGFQLVAPTPPAAKPRAVDAESTSTVSTVNGLLVNMGFKPAEAERALALVAAESGDVPVETLLKRALAQLA